MGVMMSTGKRAAQTGTILAGMAVLAMAISPAGASKKQGEKASTVEDVEKILASKPGSDFDRLKSDVDDGGTWRDQVLFALMKRVSTLPALGELELKRLDRPAHRSLMAEPARYRWRPMRMTVNVHRVMKMDGKALKAGDEYWPIDKPIWRMYCTDASVAHLAGPITIYSTVEPKGLGEASEPADEDLDDYERGELIYKRKPQVQIACVFYKLYDAEPMKGGRERSYPLAVAWQAGEAQIAGAKVDIDSKYLVAGIAIFVAGVAYYMIRKHTRRLSKPGAAVVYRSKRDDIDDEEDNEVQADEADDQPVDPLLAAAAAQYEKERQDRDADGNG